MPPQSILPGLPVERWPCSPPHSQPQQEGRIQTLLKHGWEMSPGGFPLGFHKQERAQHQHPSLAPTDHVPNMGRP